MAKLLNTSSNTPKHTYKHGSNYHSVAKIVYWKRGRQIKEQDKTKDSTMKRHADKSNSTRQLYNEEKTRQIKEKNKTKKCTMETHADVSKSRTVEKLALIKVME